MNPLGWDDAKTGTPFGSDVGRSCEPCPTLMVGLMIEMMRPLGWDDVETGAPTIEPVDRAGDRRTGLIVGLMVGLMVEVMKPLGWAFIAPVFSDPSDRLLVLSSAHEAPGWDFVRWLMERTGSSQRHRNRAVGALR